MKFKAKAASALTFLFLTFAGAAGAEGIYVPEIGSAGTAGMTIEQEKQYGDLYMSIARGTVQSYDPVLNEYFRSIGQKLVLHAPNVKFPFEFFLSSDRSLNASAFLGGKVQINAGLLHYTKSEDEFASVLAHEIAHVTQRHIARQLESRSTDASVSVGSVIAGALLSIINPDVGMAVMTTGTSIAVQRGISYTRAVEAEADRVGISILYESGFNPMAMSDLFRTLMKHQGDVSQVYAVLSDHPLSEVRVSEAYNRASQLPRRKNSTSPDFMFAKARIDVRYMGLDLDRLYERLKSSSRVNSHYRDYAIALILYEQKKYDECLSELNRLSALAKDDFIVDLKTDVFIAKGQYESAIALLEPLYRLKPKDSVICLNLGNLYIEAGRCQKAAEVLESYLKYRKEDSFAYSLLSRAYKKQGNTCRAYQALSWKNSLEAEFKKATMYMTDAIRVCRGDDREIAKEKIRLISKRQEYFERIKNDLN